MRINILPDRESLHGACRPICALICIAIFASHHSSPVHAEIAPLVSVKDASDIGTLGGTITVTVSPEWLAGKQRNNIKLYLGHRSIPDAPPTTLDLRSGDLTFRLLRTPESRDAWAAILANPIALSKKVDVSVSDGDESPIPSDHKLTLTIIPLDWTLATCSVLFAVTSVFFGWLTVSSNIIRDAGPEPTTGRKTFSLGRTQMAFWFFIVLGSYLLIWLVTRDRDVMPVEVLALLGISATTALSAVAIDSGKMSGVKADRDAAKGQQVVLDEVTTRLQPKVNDNTATPAEILELQKNKADSLLLAERVHNIEKLLAVAPSKGFVRDILQDADGVGLHRFQVVVWTIVLGIVFIWSVANTLAMPVFSATLLALLGMSGATYVGFKFQEP